VTRRGLLLTWLALAALAWGLPGLLPSSVADDGDTSSADSTVLLFGHRLFGGARPVPCDGWLATSRRALPLAEGAMDAVGSVPLLGSVWPEHEPSEALAFLREVAPLTYVSPGTRRQEADGVEGPAPRDVLALRLLGWVEMSASFYGGL
jgi:hypothetical protein